MQQVPGLCLEDRRRPCNLFFKGVPRESAILPEQAGGQSITALDLSDKMIQNAIRKAEENNITNINYLIADMSDKGVLSGTYDRITAFNVLYFIPDVKKILRKFYDMPPEDGLFFQLPIVWGNKGA